MTSDNWNEVLVKDLIEAGHAETKTGPFGTQLKASHYVDSGTPVINVRNIGFGGIRPEKLEFIALDTVERLSSHLLREDDIVFGRKGAVERHAFIRREQRNWFQGSDCLRLRFNGNGTVLPRFVSYFLLTEEHRQWMMNQCSHGATMASLNQDIISRIPLRLPPHPTQRKIASILSAYDDLIENNTRRIAILEEMAQAIYREWFVHFRFPGHTHVKLVDSPLGQIPEGWEAFTLGDLAIHERRSVKPQEVDPETPYLGLEHIPRKSITLSEWGFAADIESTKHRFYEGEILFGKIRPYFHKVIVAPFDGICSSDAIVIAAREEKHFPAVLNCVSSVPFVDHATQTSQGTKMPRANWDVLTKYPLPLPPDELLSKFNKVVNDIVASSKTMMFKNRNLRSTRDLLLPKLISGKLDVEDVDIDVGLTREALEEVTA